MCAAPAPVCMALCQLALEVGQSRSCQLPGSHVLRRALPHSVLYRLQADKAAGVQGGGGGGAGLCPLHGCRIQRCQLGGPEPNRHVLEAQGRHGAARGGGQLQRALQRRIAGQVASTRHRADQSRQGLLGAGFVAGGRGVEVDVAPLEAGRHCGVGRGAGAGGGHRAQHAALRRLLLKRAAGSAHDDD